MCSLRAPSCSSAAFWLTLLRERILCSNSGQRNHVQGRGTYWCYKLCWNPKDFAEHQVLSLEVRKTLLAKCSQNAEDFLTWTRCILCIFMEYSSKTCFVFDPDTKEFTPLAQLSKCRKNLLKKIWYFLTFSGSLVMSSLLLTAFISLLEGRGCTSLPICTKSYLEQIKWTASFSSFASKIGKSLFCSMPMGQQQLQLPTALSSQTSKYVCLF